MRDNFGYNLNLTLFGESHGDAIGAVLSGLKPGIEVKKELIEKYLSKRRPNGITSTSRIEKDEFSIDSGVFNGYTTGAPLCIRVFNREQLSEDYENKPIRKNHADETAKVKYLDFNDYRGGGRFSGRTTVAIVAVCSILINELEKKEITINSRCDVSDEEILKAKNEGISLAGNVTTTIKGLSSGIGEPYFDSFESVLSHVIFSIPGVSGIKFGEDINANNSGINGGITNGNNILFTTSFKAPVSTKKNGITGRHDSCIVNRVLPVVDSLTAFVISDFLAIKYY